MIRFPRRISLKALLFLTAAVAIICAIEVRQWQYRKRVVRTLAQYRGYAHTDSVGPEWLRNVVGDPEAFEEIDEGIFFGTASPYFDAENPVTDAELVAALAPISSGTRLTCLHLGGTLVSDRSADAIARLRFAELNLEDTNVTDEMVKRISKMTSVEELDLEGTKVTDDVVQSLAEMPKLTFLNLERTSVTDNSLEHLSISQSLTAIVVRNTNVTAEGVARLQEALPKCEVISDVSSK